MNIWTTRQTPFSDGKWKNIPASCPECRQRLHEREQLFQRMGTSIEPSWSVDLSDNVMASIRAMSIPSYSHPLTRPVVIAVIVALLISGILVLAGYRSLPEGISPVDILKLLAGSVEMPAGLRASLDELWAFAGACWIVFRILIQVIVQIGAVILFKIPGTIPMILLLSGAVLGIWRFLRQRRGSTISNFWL